MDDPRPDELLEQAGRTASRLGLATGWTDGIKGVDAKACSGTGSRYWPKAKAISPDGEFAAGHFRDRCRRRNPLVPAGASGLVLVEADLDVPDDAYPPLGEVKARVAALLTRLGLRFPRSVVVRSRRGLHFYLRPDVGCKPAKIQISEDGDPVTYSSDGYVVGVPGLHELSGVVYEYVYDGAVAVLPASTQNRLAALGEETRARTARIVESGGPIPKGQRTDTLKARTLELIHDGVSFERVLADAFEFNKNRCQPPLDNKIVTKNVRGLFRWASAHPSEAEQARAEARRVLDELRAGEARGPREKTTAGNLTWEDPVPLTGRAQVPAFPIGVLPGWLRDWAIEIAREKSASVDLAAALGLGVVAGAIARHVQVSPRPGWWEPVNLYLAIALEPGQRKTPIFKAAFRPVRALERARMQGWVDQNELVELSGEILDKRRKELIAEAADDDALDSEQLRERMDELLGGLGPTEATPMPRLLTEDVTPEGLASLLADHGRIIAASDEGAAIFENLAGRYARGSTSWDVFNKAHSAADLVVDRKSSGPVIVWDPALTLVIATQPKVLHDLWSKPGAEGRGVLARPLYAFPDPAYEVGRTAPAASVALSAFDAATRALYDDVPLLALDEEGKPQPVTLHFAGEAEPVFELYEEQLGRERRELGTSDEAEDEAVYLGWLSKLAGQTARLAACLHVAARWTEGATVNATVDREQVENAIELARYFHAHARVVFGLIGQLPEHRRALAILGWLRQRPEPELDRLTVRDVHRTRGKGTQAEEVRAALGLLEQHGYVRIERPPRAGSAGRATEHVHVHPEIKNRPLRPDKPDTGTPTSGLSGRTGRDSLCAEHPDASVWKARDGRWRCNSCTPPAFPGEVLEERHP